MSSVTKSASYVDKEVGKRIKHLRKEKKLSLKDIAEETGISFQQLHKYETGLNRIPISRLYSITKILDIGIGRFFDDISESSNKSTLKSESGAFISGVNSSVVGGSGGVSGTDEGLEKYTSELVELINKFAQIHDTKKRRRILKFVDKYIQEKDKGNIDK